MSASPFFADEILAIFFFGLLLIYLECNRPGFVLPGCLGFLLVVLAGKEVGTWPLSFWGVTLCVLGGLLIFASIFRSGYYVVCFGCLAMTEGLRVLVRPDGASHVHATIAAIYAFGAGSVSVWLGRTALAARRYKRSSLSTAR